MKVLVSLTFVIASTLAHADQNSDRIAELKAEIAQREATVAQMQQDNKPTGRVEMTIFRLKRELEKRQEVAEMTATTQK